MELYLILILIMVSMLIFVFSYLSLIYLGIVREQRRIDSLVELQEQQNRAQTQTQQQTAGTTAGTTANATAPGTATAHPNTSSASTPGSVIHHQTNSASTPGTDGTTLNAGPGTNGTNSTTDLSEPKATEKTGVGKWVQGVGAWGKAVAKRVGGGKREGMIEIGLGAPVVGGTARPENGKGKGNGGAKRQSRLVDADDLC